MTQPPPAAWQPPWPPPWQASWQAPRPGCVPLRPLGLSDILDGSFTAIRRNPKVMLGLSAAVATVQVVLVALVEVVAYAQLGRITITSTSGATTRTSLGPLLGTETVQLVTLFVSTLLGAFLTGMLTIAITQDVLGVRLDVRQVWQRVQGRLWRLVGLSLLTTFLEFLGLVLCLAPGIWLWGTWAVAVPVMMVERTTVRGALRRSRALVAGTFWRVWGIRALGWITATVIGAIIAVPFAIAGLVLDGNVFSATASSGHLPAGFLILTAFGSAVSAAFTAPIRAGIDALLYVDLRMRREGLDIALQQALAQPMPPVPPRATY